MKIGLTAVTAACGFLMLGATASYAGPKIKYYAITGSTGMELYMSMVKRGPRHGLLSRAIAQTSYQVVWNTEVERVNGGCRSTSARPTLQITYSYPKPPERISPALRARWNRFMVGVRRHEETHGKLARQMVDEAYKTIRGLQIAGDSSCSKTRQELKRRADAAYEHYEDRQAQFDKYEHRNGGNIDRLILALVKDK